VEDIEMPIAFLDMAAELGISSNKLIKLRAEKLTPSEYYKDGTKSYFTDEAAEKLRLAVAIPLAVPSKATARVIRAAVNPRFVMVKLEGVDGLRPVNIPRRLYGRLIGKTITVDIIKDAQGGTSYRHEALGS
jgi:hypothetical protein